MKKYLYILMSAVLMVMLAGCTGDVDNSVYRQMEIGLKNFSNTGCKPYTRSGGNDYTDGSYFELTAVKGNMLYVKHINAWFNCASNQFEAKVEVDGNSIIVSEYDMTQLEYATTCMCPFDLGYEIGPLKEGTKYSFKIITCKGPAPLVQNMVFETQEVTFDIVYSSKLSKIFDGKELSDHFCVEGKTWVMKSAPSVAPELRVWSYTETRLKGDTIINGIQFMGMYNRSWKEGEPTPEEWAKTQQYLGEENGKIYRYSKSSDVMKTILDFSLQKGDTFPFADEIYLTVIGTADSLVIGSTDGIRRRCILLGMEGEVYDTWAEGIGSLQFGITDVNVSKIGVMNQFVKCYIDDKILYEWKQP